MMLSFSKLIAFKAEGLACWALLRDQASEEAAADFSAESDQLS